MTAVKSESNNPAKTLRNNFIKARIKTNFIENRKLFTVICILHAIGYPLIMALGVYEEYYYETHQNSTHYPDTSLLMVAGVIAGIVALCAGMVIAMNVFKYLYKKSYVDMNLSLPLTAKQRFFTDFLSGLVMYIVPALCAWIIGDLIGLIGLGLDIDNMSEVLNTMNRCGLCVIMAMILFYTFTVFCTVCCGNIVETIASSFLINIVVPMFLFVLGLCICQDYPYGVSSEAIMFEQIFFTSPVGCIIFAVFSVDSYYIASTNNPYLVFWLISIILYTAVIITVSYFLYKKRKAESVSKPYIYKFLYYALTSAILFSIISIVSLDSQDFFSAIFIGAIIYFIFEVITKRGFKKFHYSVIRYIGTVMAIMIVVTSSNITKGFGIYKYVPNPAGVSQVNFQTNYYISNSNYTFENIYSDKNVIKAITEVHKSYVDQYENTENYNFNYAEDVRSRNSTYTVQNQVYVRFQYYMKNGNIVPREYEITYEDYYKIISAMMLSEEYREKAEKQIKFIYETSSVESKWLSFKESKTDKEFSNEISEKKVDELITAYQTDLENMTLEDYYSSQTIGFIYDSFEIRETFSNTIAIIKEIEPKFHTTPDDFDISDFAPCTVQVYSDVIFADTILYDAEPNYSYSLHRISNKYIGINMQELYYYNNSNESYSIGSQTDFPKLEELLNVSKSVYNSDEIGGIIRINEKCYFVPVEYKELAKSVENSINRQNTPLYQEEVITNLNENIIGELTNEYGTIYYELDNGMFVTFDDDGGRIYFDGISELPQDVVYYDGYGNSFIIEYDGTVTAIDEKIVID